MPLFSITLPTSHTSAAIRGGLAHGTYLSLPPHTSRHTDNNRSLHGRTRSCRRGLEYVLDRDNVVDTTLVGTVLNGLVQVRGGETVNTRQSSRAFSGVQRPLVTKTAGVQHSSQKSKSRRQSLLPNQT